MPTLRSLIFAGLLCTAATASAQIPQMIAYQGRVAAGGVNFHGTGQFKFAIVNGAYGGLPGETAILWSNDGSLATTAANGVPTASVSLTCDRGLYSVLLGNTAAGMVAVPPSAFALPDVRLRVWFNDGTHGFQLLTPDQRLVSVGYAMMAASAQTVPDGSINSLKLANGAVTAGKLADNSVVSSNLVDNSVTSAKINLGAVNTDKILDGTVGSADLANSAVTGAKIAPAAVTVGNIADAAITSAKILAAAVGTAQLADAAVTIAKLADGAVSTAKLADAAVTTAKLSPGAVGTQQIQNNAVRGAEILDGSVGNADLASSAVTAAKIAANTITAAEIATGAVGSAEIADLSVNTVDLASGAVTATKLGNAAVTAAALADSAVTTAKLQDTSVTYQKMALNSITEGEIVDGSVRTPELATGAVTIPKLAPALSVRSTHDLADMGLVQTPGWNVVPWPRETYDTQNFHDNVTNNSRFVAPVTGLYQINGNLQGRAGQATPLESYLNPSLHIAFRVNGTTIVNFNSNGTDSADAIANDYYVAAVSLTDVIRLNAGDYVEVLAQGTTREGGGISYYMDLYRGTFSMVCIGSL